MPIDSSDNPPIGGFLPLDLPDFGAPLGDAKCFQSARGAFRALVRHVQPRRVYLPRLICDSMVESLIDEGVDHVWYDLTTGGLEPENIRPGRSDIILYVNYFGVFTAECERVTHRFPPDQLVFDYSQALFEPEFPEALATIYSPRKFIGIPDGGMLSTKLGVSEPRSRDGGSIARCEVRLRRLDEDPEPLYPDYCSAEQSLSSTEPRAMSGFTRRLLRANKLDEVAERRNANFARLHRRLGGLNQLDLDGLISHGPLCYPLCLGGPDIRERLKRRRVFVPTYWPEALARVSKEFGARMITGLLPLPIDQRYGPAEMDHLAQVVGDTLK